MRPQKAYILNFGNKSKLTFCLIVALILQIFLYSISKSKIEIPSIIIKYGINYLGISKKIQVETLEYKFPNKFFVEKTILSNENGIYSFKNTFFTLNSLFDEIIFDKLRIEEINIQYNQDDFLIKDVIAYKDNQNIKTQFHLNSKFFDIKLKGNLNKRKLIGYKSSRNTKFSDSKAINFVDNMKKYFLKDSLSQKPKFMITMSIDNNLVLNFKQLNNSKNTFINGSSGFIHLIENDLHILKINAKANNISIRNSSNLVRGNIINFSYLNPDIFQILKHEDEIKLSVQNIEVSGKFNGVIPPLEIQSYYKNKNRHINLFSNSNCTTFSNNIITNDSKVHRITGFNTIIPKSLDIKINAYDTKYNFLDGDYLIIDLYNNEPNSHSNITYIKAKASNFSVLETPFADFNASGFLENDLTFNFNNVNCSMGETKVQGTYKQHWNPHRYEFLLIGNLLPTNINNWFGDWWDKIWQDFKFDPKLPPFGNFIIKGNWKNNSNHSTVGVINSKNLIYKNFFIDNSNLQISIDQNSTLIDNIKLNHSTGSLNGSISILKGKNFKYNNLNYSLEGTLPVNDCKKVFGRTIETILNDFNLPSVLITSEGQIPIEANDLNYTASSNNFFTIDLFTDQNGSWRNIKFSSLKGNINSNFETIKFNFPFIGFANGRLMVNLSFSVINDLISLSFELINANIKSLYLSFLNFQDQNNRKFINSNKPDFISNNGTLDLKLKANGSMDDFPFLKGSGKITAFDKELSKLELLGFLSRGLSEIPIPLPTGTLNFNKLEGLFELEHEQLKFDRIVLSGLFSKIDNRGSFNFNNGQLDIISKVQLIGNLPIPFFKQFAQFADPLSSFAEIKISGTWSDPQWKLLIKPLK